MLDIAISGRQAQRRRPRRRKTQPHHSLASNLNCSRALLTYPFPCASNFRKTMSMATIIPQVSRASTSSSSSFAPVSRQNTVSSHDGRSARQSKRYSTALYLSMSAKEKDLEIEDELARGECKAAGIGGGRR